MLSSSSCLRPSGTAPCPSVSHFPASTGPQTAGFPVWCQCRGRGGALKGVTQPGRSRQLFSIPAACESLPGGLELGGITIVRTALVCGRRAWSSLQPLHVVGRKHKGTAETSVTPAPLTLPPRFSPPKAAWRRAQGPRVRSAPWTAPQEVTGAAAKSSARPLAAPSSAAQRAWPGTGDPVFVTAFRAPLRTLMVGSGSLGLQERARPPSHFPRLRLERNHERGPLSPLFRGAPGQPLAPWARERRCWPCRCSPARWCCSAAPIEPSFARAWGSFLVKLSLGHLLLAALDMLFMLPWWPPSGRSAYQAVGFLDTFLESNSVLSTMALSADQWCVGFHALLCPPGWSRRGDSHWPSRSRCFPAHGCSAVVPWVRLASPASGPPSSMLLALHRCSPCAASPGSRCCGRRRVTADAPTSSPCRSCAAPGSAPQLVGLRVPTQPRRLHPDPVLPLGAGSWSLQAAASAPGVPSLCGFPCGLLPGFPQPLLCTLSGSTHWKGQALLRVRICLWSMCPQ